MKNKEKYAYEILNGFIHTEKNCGFRKKYVLKNDICDNIDCRKCNKLTEEWLEAEYITPKTRQSKFLEMFPNARLDNKNCMDICPRCINSDYICPMKLGLYYHTGKVCEDCRQEYWSEEID